MVFCLVLFSLLSYKPQRINSEEPIIIKPTLQEYISLYAHQYGASEKELLAVAKCESSFNQNAIGDGGRAIGVFQFHRPTWESFSRKLGERLDINSYQDQAKLASWAFANNYKSHWVCYNKIK